MMSYLKGSLITQIILAVCLLISPLMGKQHIYEAPPALMNEVRSNLLLVDANPTYANTVFELAMSYAYTGQIEKGWATLKKVPNYDPDYAPKVIEKYSKLIESDPTNWKYHFKLAFGYYFLKKKEMTISQFDNVLKIDPKHIWAMGFKAVVLGEIGKEDETVVICNEDLLIEPQATAIHFLLAEGYRRQGRYWKATLEALKVGRLKASEKISGYYDTP